jgi:alkyl hydroperoxide reductase subunit D
VDSHEQTLRNQGVTEETILAAVRIASVVHAVACVLDAVAAADPVPAPAAQAV